jgi:nucleoid-associated protein YgaU
MRNQRRVAALVAGSLLVAAALGAGQVRAEGSTKPPTHLKLVGDHWTPWDPPAPGPDAYIIQKGDTLWDLAAKWLGDPFLWPQIWDENRYILDSHWIYPGDPLVIPGRPTVVPETGPEVSEAPDEPADSGEGEPVAAEPRPRPAPPVPPLVPVADATDLYCSGRIEPEHLASEVRVAGREMENEHAATGDVIFLNQGSNQGIQAGDEFAIVRPARGVTHPTDGRDLGTYVRRLGKVRVLLTQSATSTAVIEMSCEDIRDRDELVPWTEIPAPMRRSLPPFDRYDPTASGGPTGHIVLTGDNLDVVGTGNVIHTDLGVAAGVQPGDVLTLFRDNGDLPRLNLGQAVVLTVEPGTSTAIVTVAVREMGLGDRAELVR